MLADELRPTEWDDYIGQEAMKDRLSTHIDAALIQQKQLPHVLLTGVPGCGKTTLARIIANAYGADFWSFIMPFKEQALLKFLRSCTGVVLFDEIHRLTPKQQETLLPLIEDGYYQKANGDRVEARDLTIIGATTEPEKIIAPLWDRFQIKPPFDEYTDNEMTQIVMRMTIAFGIEVGIEECHVLGRAAGGVPRNAASLVQMTNDLIVTGQYEGIADTLIACRVSEDGLTEEHRRYCKVLAEAGGVAGLEIIGAHLRMAKTVIVDLERLLVKRGMISYSKQGRELLGPGWELAQEDS